MSGPIQYSPWSAQNQAASPLVISLPAAPTSGDTIVINVNLLNNFETGNVTSITDNQSGSPNTYTLVKAQIDGEGGVNCRTEQWACQSVLYSSGGLQLTINFTAGQFVNAQVAELPPSTLNSSAGAGTTTFPIAVSCAAKAGDILMATLSVAYGSNNITDPPTGTGTYLSMGTLPLVDGYEEGESAYQVAASTQTYTAHWTWTVGEDGAVVMSSWTPRGGPSAALAGVASANAFMLGALAVPLSGIMAAKAAFTIGGIFSSMAAAEAYAAGTLLNWASVTLVAPLYAGLGGALDGYLWTTPVPQAGTTLYYDPTFITIASDGEISSTSNNCTALIGFYDPVAGWTVATYTLTPGGVAVASGSSSMSGQLSGAQAFFAAVAAALASSSGQLSTGIALGVSASSLASMSGALTTAARLAAAGYAVASLTGTLTTVGALAGAADAVAHASGALLTVIEAAGSANAKASAAATLTTGVTLAGIAGGKAAMGGQLTSAVAAALSGAADALASAAGRLLTAITVAGFCGAKASAFGTLTVPKPLSGFGAALCTASGTLSTGTGFSGKGAALASMLGSLQTQSRFASMAAAVASFTASLTTVPALPSPVLLSHQIPGIYQPGEIPQGQFELPAGEVSFYAIDWTYWLAFLWQPGFSAPLNYVVRPFPWTGYQYIVTTAGQTGNYPPVWPEEDALFVVDGSVIWQAEPIDSTSLQTSVVSATYEAPVGLTATAYMVSGNLTPVQINATAATPGTTYTVTCTALMASGDFLIGELIFNVR